MRKKCEEYELQCLCVRYMRTHYPKVFDLAFAVPNGEYRLTADVVRLRAMGAKPGVPDIFIPLFTKTGQVGVFVEFKTAVGELSPAQKEYTARIDEQDYAFDIVRNMSQFSYLMKKHYERYYVENDTLPEIKE